MTRRPAWTDAKLAAALKATQHVSVALDRINNTPVRMAALLDGSYRAAAAGVPFDVLDSALDGVEWAIGQHGESHTVPNATGDAVPLSTWRDDLESLRDSVEPIRKQLHAWLADLAEAQRRQQLRESRHNKREALTAAQRAEVARVERLERARKQAEDAARELAEAEAAATAAGKQL